MIIAELNGGLGNQMFQYAFGKMLSLEFNCELLVDISQLGSSSPLKNVVSRNYELDVFDAEIMFASEKLVSGFNRNGAVKSLLRKLRLPHTKTFIEDTDMKRVNISSIVPPVMVKGYWQSQSYFIKYKEQIKKEFTFKRGSICSVHAQTALIHEKQSVSIHIRRGDYITNLTASNVLGVLDPEYYKSSINLICDRIERPYFYVFSDDPTWAIQNFSHIPDLEIIDSRGMGSHIDLWLMSNCKHNIIANSSYSWWAAWLNKNNDKVVIAPRRWFKDSSLMHESLVPSDWLTI